MSDKAPYVISLILGVLGWLVSHIVDRITESPTLEYHVVEQRAGSERRLDVTLTNVSRNRRFDSLKASIAYPGAEVDGRGVNAMPPARTVAAPPDAVGATASFDLATLMPGERVELWASSVTTVEPVLRVWSDASQPLRLQKRGVETFFVHYEVPTLAFLIFVWIAALSLLGLFALKRRSKDPKDESSTAASNSNISEVVSAKES